MNPSAPMFRRLRPLGTVAASGARSARRTVALALAVSVLSSTLMLAAAWAMRSEARAHRSARTASKGASYSYGFTTNSVDSDDEFWYAVLEPGSNTTFGKTNGRSWKAIRRLLDSSETDLWWFSLRGDDYVVRDPALIEKVRELVEPMQELGERQSRLGAVQSLLGSRQAEIGSRQARIGAHQAVLSGRLARAATRNALGQRDALSEREEDAIQRELEALSRRQTELSRRQEPLSRRQEEFGRQQEALGREMEQLSARVTPEVRRLAEDAIHDGKAERLDD